MPVKHFLFFTTFVFLTALITQSFFIIDQTQQAIVLQLGQPIGKPREPGLHFKTPFIQNVRYFDRRVLSIDPEPKQVVISSTSKRNIKTSEQKPSATASTPQIDVSAEPIIVDTFARYRITDPLQFLKTLGTVANANSRLENIIDGSTRAILGETTLPELLSPERASIMNAIRNRVNSKIKEDRLGIEIVDVRIVRADLNEKLLSSTVKQMNSALRERATERRAKGEERALEIRSTAEKERTIILAEAQRDSQIIRGEGDKEAIKIYADAFNIDKEFYSFIRSMEAYRNALANPQTRLILSPDSEFFRHFDEKGGE